MIDDNPDPGRMMLDRKVLLLTFLLLLSIFSFTFGYVGNSSSYQITSIHTGTVGGSGTSSSYSQRFTTTYQQPSGSGETTSYELNVGWFGLTTVVNGNATINSVECSNDTIHYYSCDRMLYGMNITHIRVNCTSLTSNITDVRFTLYNRPDNISYINNVSYTYRIGDYYILNSSFLLVDSGEWNLTVVCEANTSPPSMDVNTTVWNLPFGHINITVLSPPNGSEVIQNQMFEYHVLVQCIGGECGIVNLTLDPEPGSGSSVSGKGTYEMSGGSDVHLGTSPSDARSLSEEQTSWFGVLQSILRVFDRISRFITNAVVGGQPVNGSDEVVNVSLVEEGSDNLSIENQTRVEDRSHNLSGDEVSGGKQVRVEKCVRDVSVNVSLEHVHVKRIPVKPSKPEEAEEIEEQGEVEEEVEPEVGRETEVETENTEELGWEEGSGVTDEINLTDEVNQTDVINQSSTSENQSQSDVLPSEGLQQNLSSNESQPEILSENFTQENPQPENLSTSEIGSESGEPTPSDQNSSEPKPVEHVPDVNVNATRVRPLPRPIPIPLRIHELRDGPFHLVMEHDDKKTNSIPLSMNASDDEVNITFSVTKGSGFVYLLNLVNDKRTPSQYMEYVGKVEPGMNITIRVSLDHGVLLDGKTICITKKQVKQKDVRVDLDHVVGCKGDLYLLGMDLPRIDVGRDHSVMYIRENNQFRINIISPDNSSVEVYSPTVLHGSVRIYPIENVSRVNDTILLTDVVYANLSNISSARVRLRSLGIPDTILMCNDSSFANGTCILWEPINISFTYSDGWVSFNVGHFTAYAGGNLSNNETGYLVIWDDNDDGMPYVSRKIVSQPVRFYADYRTTENGTPITNGSCVLSVDNETVNMVYNSSLGLYIGIHTFSLPGIYYYNITCNSSGYPEVEASDDIRVSSSLNKSGAVSTTTGDVPFYTIDDNPQTCDLSVGGSSCDVVWHVNATGSLGSTHKFYVIGRMITNRAYVSDVNSSFTHLQISVNDTTPPVILSTSVSHRVWYKNGNVSIYLTASDNVQLDDCWVNITLPNSSVDQMFIHDPITYNLTQLGNYSLMFACNDSKGNLVENDGGVIEVYPPISLRLIVGNLSNDLPVYVHMTCDRPGCDLLEGTYYGLINETLPSLIYDIHMSTYNNRLDVIFYDVNLSIDNNKSTLFDHVNLPGYLKVYVINTTFTTYDYAQVKVCYDDVAYHDEGRLRLFKCDDWDYLGKVCAGSWTDITTHSYQDTTNHCFVYNTTSFSGFGIVEPSDSGSGSSSRPSLDVDVEVSCLPQPIKVYVTSKGDPVDRVRAVLFRLSDGIPYKVDENYSGSDGVVLLRTSQEGRYKVSVSKDGYRSTESVFDISCSWECLSDEDCSDDQTCSDHECIQVSCPCGMVSNHTCHPYECCEDSDCESGYVCVEHNCTLEQAEEDVQGVNQSTNQNLTQNESGGEQEIEEHGEEKTVSVHVEPSGDHWIIHVYDNTGSPVKNYPIVLDDGKGGKYIVYSDDKGLVVAARDVRYVRDLNESLLASLVLRKDECDLLGIRQVWFGICWYYYFYLLFIGIIIYAVYRVVYSSVSKSSKSSSGTLSKEGTGSVARQADRTPDHKRRVGKKKRTKR